MRKSLECMGKTAYDAVADILGTSLVFRAVENARRHGAADESVDWARHSRRRAACDAVCVMGPQAPRRSDPAASGFRIYPAREFFLVSARELISTLGSCARCARRHRRAGRGD